jgi:peptide-methionine (S)-S-oxide reductase
MKLFFNASLIIYAAALTACTQPKAESTETTTAASVISDQKDLSQLQTATFASGCFWCMEGVFESVKGVQEAVSGYSGGTEQNPTYEQVGSGETGHAEAVQVYYDSTVVNYAALLKVYFASEDPTQVNGQGPDRGKQYRSIIFYRNDQEKKLAEAEINKMNASGTLNGKVAAQLVPYVKFWEAEKYHQDYIKLNPNESYVLHESIPRIKRFQAKMPELIKPDKMYK